MIGRVKQNDTVMVISGKDKGKTGKVIEVLPEKNLVKVQNIAVVTRHVKARRQGEVAGIKKEEGFINLSKVMPICDGKPTRVNTKMLENGTSVRVSNKGKVQF